MTWPLEWEYLPRLWAWLQDQWAAAMAYLLAVVDSAPSQPAEQSSPSGIISDTGVLADLGVSDFAQVGIALSVAFVGINVAVKLARKLRDGA